MKSDQDLRGFEIRFKEIKRLEVAGGEPCRWWRWLGDLSQPRGLPSLPQVTICRNMWPQYTSSDKLPSLPQVTICHNMWPQYTSSDKLPSLPQDMWQYVTSIHIKWQTAKFTSSYNISCLSYVTICDLNTPQVTICHPLTSTNNMSRLSQVTISYLNKPQGTKSHLYLKYVMSILRHNM